MVRGSHGLNQMLTGTVRCNYALSAVLELGLTMPGSRNRVHIRVISRLGRKLLSTLMTAGRPACVVVVQECDRPRRPPPDDAGRFALRVSQPPVLLLLQRILQHRLQPHAPGDSYLT